MPKPSSHSFIVKILFHKNTLSRVTVSFGVPSWNRCHTQKIIWKIFKEEIIYKDPAELSEPICDGDAPRS